MSSEKGKIELSPEMEYLKNYLDKKFDGLDKRFDGLDKRFNQLETRLELKVESLKAYVDDLNTEFSFACAASRYPSARQPIALPTIHESEYSHLDR